MSLFLYCNKLATHRLTNNKLHIICYINLKYRKYIYLSLCVYPNTLIEYRSIFFSLIFSDKKIEMQIKNVYLIIQIF